MRGSRNPSKLDCRTARFEWFLLVLLAVFLWPPPGLAQKGLKAWEFETLQESDAARRAYGRDKADTQFSNGKRAREKGRYDEAIARLKLAIAQEDRSGELMTGQGDEILYFPYWELGLAYEKTDVRKAMACLQEELAQGQIAKYEKRHKPAFEADFARIQVRYELEPARDLANEMIAWGAPGGSLQLSDAGKIQLDAVKRERDRVIAAQESGSADAKPLLSELWKLCDVELGNNRQTLEYYRTDPAWTGVLQEQRFRSYADTASCEMPGQGKNLETVERAKAVLEDCSEKVSEAMRQAGFWKCREISEQIKQLGTVGETPGPPKECGEIKNAGRMALEQKNRALVVASSAMGTRFRERNAEISSIQAKWEADRGAALNRIPTLPSGCESTIGKGLADVKRSFDTIRRKLESASKREDYEDYDTAIDRETANLKSVLERKVVGLGNDYRRCKKDQSQLSDLDNALAAYRESATELDLGTLCNEARGATQAISSCWTAESGQVQKDLSAWAAKLGRADRWLGPLVDLPELSDFDLECVSALHSRMKDRRVGKSNTSINQAVADNAEAGDCLYALDEARAEISRDLSKRVNDVESGLRRGADASDKVQGLWSEAQDLQKDLRALSSDTLAEDSTSSLFLRASRKLRELEQVNFKLGPFLALGEAFERFRAGNVDQAIQSLRGDLADGGRIPGSGESAALGHAVLSYLLWVKYQAALEGADQVAELLSRDARTEAAITFGVDRHFELPDMLSSNTNFKSFFENEKPRGQS